MMYFARGYLDPERVWETMRPAVAALTAGTPGMSQIVTPTGVPLSADEHGVYAIIPVSPYAAPPAWAQQLPLCWVTCSAQGFGTTPRDGDYGVATVWSMPDVAGGVSIRRWFLTVSALSLDLFQAHFAGIVSGAEVPGAYENAQIAA